MRRLDITQSPANGRARTMMQKFFWRSRDALPEGRRASGWLRDGLAALPEPWTVLATRRRSGSDGPPWVRYVVLHPAKGVALVDVDPTEPAVAPFEDFFEHTGLAALQSGALPVVAVTLPVDGSAPVAETIDAAFAETRCQFGNPYWCEAIVELLLTTQELRLTRLRRKVPLLSKPDTSTAARAPSLTVGPVATPTVQVDEPASSGVFSEPAPLRTAVETREPRMLGSHGLPRLQTWRSWPTSPVTAAAIALAIAAVLLVSHEASPPTHQVAAIPALDRGAPVVSARTDARPSVTVATVSPPSTVGRTPEGANSVPQIPLRKTTPAARPSPRSIVRRPLRDRDARQTPQRASPASRERRMAAAASPRPAPGTACADVLHPNRPGGWRYRGPPVSGCLPIRFFGLIGMR